MMAKIVFFFFGISEVSLPEARRISAFISIKSPFWELDYDGSADPQKLSKNIFSIKYPTNNN